MKNSLLFFYLLVSTSFVFPPGKFQDIVTPDAAAENLFIIITDGFRWQEIFKGADSLLLHNEEFTPDAQTIRSMYWATDIEERRKKLMPFFWNVIAKDGQLMGNREIKNKVNVANIYAVSYPGYNEIFTGTTDLTITGNSKKNNPNLNILECLNRQEGFEGKIAVFSSWDVFPYILNRDRNNLLMNSGYEHVNFNEGSDNIKMINAVQDKGIRKKTATRYDQLTFTTAKEYIMNNHPRVVVLGFGETDDFAHQKRYDLYLQQANQVDRMIGELWHMVQSTPGYKDKTNFLITTDHGRGNNEKQWSDHGTFIKGSFDSWIAMMGPNIEPLGERMVNEQFYSKQLAETIATLTGQKFIPEKP